MSNSWRLKPSIVSSVIVLMNIHLVEVHLDVVRFFVQLLVDSGLDTQVYRVCVCVCVLV